ncbi:ParA family protein [Ancylobacter lacus]|uniref:ParA family protein n=1 Tax=Ancylobacter lacus TaxID=2579970 RepID=UPI001BCABFFA|nr:AAA family ATPase [Ancylobacter lacus]MBS7537768.1 AAA family ATPase [Ancylobacter lacus]
MSAVSTIFWNNKGGTGKTSLAFQSICSFAKKHSDKKILVIDVCPQANLSELFLGGLEYNGSDNLLKIQGKIPRATVGGYFQYRLPSPFSIVPISSDAYISNPFLFNKYVPQNIYLMAGDPLLELQSNSMSTLANTQIPGTDTWIKIVSWLKDFISATEGKYDYIFLDANPSFSIYTQIAMAAADRVILPVMADDSSRRAIQNAFSLIFGLKLPSEIYAQHMFATRIKNGGLSLPKVHLIVKNRITQYVVAASAYRAVLNRIDDDVKSIINLNPEYFSFSKSSDGVLEIRDFQTTGVVAFARGTPFFALEPGKRSVGGKRVQLDAKQIADRRDEVDRLADFLA